eukprot:GHUV01001995.1.p1 GENE.GHUV01001995.1~~GHUV01001995.1.p1  ORF type:complete len:566 (+),score=283.94 GHUV01001995.1:59-1756(+)
MATEAADNPVSAEQLTEAEEKYTKAIELRDKDPDAAIELLGQVLEIRNKAYGEKALECADVYLYYGELLFEQAQASTDYLGDQMKSAAMQRAKQIASGEAAGDDAADDAAAEDEADADMEDENADAQPSAEADAPSATDTTPTADPAAPAAAEAPATADADMQQAAEATEPSPATATAADEQAATVTDEQAGGEQDEAEAVEAEQEEDEESGESDGDDGEDVDDAAEGEAGEQQEQQVTGESDDMALAWEMLEMARLIYSENGGADKHANKLADCHMYIGDILAEQEKFEEGVQEFTTALEMLAKVEGGLSAVQRRAAELEFKKSTALQLSDQPAEALKAIHSAKAHLQARLNELTSQLASKAGATGASSDAAGAAAFAAFASVLSSYKPADPDTSKDSSQAAADAALQQEVADLRSVIESMGDRIDELNAAVEAHEDMRETIRKTFAAVASGQGSGGAAAAADGGGSSDAAPADAGPTETIGFGSAPVPAGPVQDIGVIGKGKRAAPVPVADAAAVADVNKKRALLDVSNSDPEAAAAVAQDNDGRKDKVQGAGEQAEAKRMKV